MLVSIRFNGAAAASHSWKEVLFLSSNKFTGSLAPILGDTLVENLQGLYLSDNDLNGSLPTGLCALTNLSTFPDSASVTPSLPFFLHVVLCFQRLCFWMLTTSQRGFLSVSETCLICANCICFLTPWVGKFQCSYLNWLNWVDSGLRTMISGVLFLVVFVPSRRWMNFGPTVWGELRKYCALAALLVALHPSVNRCWQNMFGANYLRIRKTGKLVKVSYRASILVDHSLNICASDFIKYKCLNAKSSSPISSASSLRNYYVCVLSLVEPWKNLVSYRDVEPEPWQRGHQRIIALSWLDTLVFHQCCNWRLTGVLNLDIKESLHSHDW